jgi:hypothetical protein
MSPVGAQAVERSRSVGEAAAADDLSLIRAATAWAGHISRQGISMSQRRRSKLQLRRPSLPRVFRKLSLSRRAKQWVGALALSVTAAGSRVQSAQVALTMSPSGMAISVAVEAAAWQTRKVLNVRTPGGPFDMVRACGGNSGNGCASSCGGVMIGPFSAGGVTVSIYAPMTGRGLGGISCVDIQLSPLLGVSSWSAGPALR